MTDVLSRLARSGRERGPLGAAAWKGKQGKRPELEIVLAKGDK